MHRLMGPSFIYKFQRLFGLSREKQVALAVPVIDEFVFSMIRKRKENAEQFVESGDLLSLFVTSAAKANAAKDKNGSAAAASGSSEDVASSALSDRELRDIVLNFMIVCTSKHTRTHAQTVIAL